MATTRHPAYPWSFAAGSSPAPRQAEEPDREPTGQDGSRSDLPTTGLLCPYCTTPAELVHDGHYLLRCCQCCRVYTDPAAKGMRRSDRGQS